MLNKSTIFMFYNQINLNLQVAFSIIHNLLCFGAQRSDQPITTQKVLKQLKWMDTWHFTV